MMHRFVGLVRFRGDAQRYGLRLLLAMALALALMTIAFRWPEAPADRAVSVLIDRPGREVIALDEIVQTRQEQQPPPPPAPLPPVVVPDDRVLPVDELDLQPLAVTDEGELESQEVSAGDDGAPRDAAETVSPRLVRFVEPVLPREAQRRRLRVEAVVELVVNDRGAVDDATILELYTLDDDVRTLVLEVGYGIERAILDAARSCRFRPGRVSGQPTTAATQLIFTVGR